MELELRAHERLNSEDSGYAGDDEPNDSEGSDAPHIETAIPGLVEAPSAKKSKRSSLQLRKQGTIHDLNRERSPSKARAEKSLISSILFGKGDGANLDGELQNAEEAGERGVADVLNKMDSDAMASEKIMAEKGQQVQEAVERQR